MGIFTEKVVISNPENLRHSAEIDMVVDSGATYSWVPKDFLLGLGIQPKFKRRLKLADGSIIERQAAIANFTLKGETLPSLVIFGDEKSESLLGVITLGEFSLAIDPVSKTLIPVPSRLL